MNIHLRRASAIAATSLGLLLAAAVFAPPQPDARSVRGTTRTSVNRNVNVHHTLAVGRVLGGLPPACRPVSVGNTAYQRCGDAWYQPCYAGAQIAYVVVAPPR